MPQRPRRRPQREGGGVKRISRILMWVISVVCFEYAFGTYKGLAVYGAIQALIFGHGLFDEETK